MNAKLKSKNILGYTLQERIGAGGFGEVWSAIAPGGLMKAVKVVYGFHDEKRAQAELKALDRVKEVRHPFLLSLERIEVHEGQLIVVSELADKSLADLFNEYAARGEPGIPRDELIRYTMNAADALDYLSREHNLQHLDIKPENMLLVSGHVKVADFGLIKDLHNVSQSLMAGMTPAYAAPELFDGRPGPRSDQYSLAVVYQEMLTAVRPFAGTTPAQLAAQHMHGKPNLRPLPQSDQTVIARALAKDPGVRFECCRAMAEELFNRKRSTKKAIRRSVARDRADTESKTVSFDNRENTALMSSKALPFQANEIKLADPPSCDPAAAKLQPTLIVGVGGSANRVVKRLKEQLVVRHNSMDDVPSIGVICIDTDRNDLTRMCTAGDETALDFDETINTSLFKPEVYRQKKNSHLNWLSRRWIYNIPRSLQTEGLRPLGRLAFADHFDTVCNTIEKALTEITAAENLAKTSETLEMNPGVTQPRVFIVSSISGGVGSGMTLDLAYTIKLLMAEQGLDTDSVAGILLHSTYQRSRDPGLSSANAFAFLTELRHYVEAGYPGDENIGLPAFDEEPPFDFTYFNELGNDLSQTNFDAKLNSVAEYLYLSATTRCSEFLDTCRQHDDELEHFALRTFGVSLAGPGSHLTGVNAVNRLSHSLVQRWIHGCPDADFDPHQQIDALAKELKLNPDALVDQIQVKTKQEFGQQFDSLMAQARNLAIQPNDDRFQQMVDQFDTEMGCPESRRDTSHVDPDFCLEFQKQLGNEAIVVADRISNEALALLGGTSLELNQAIKTVDQWLESLEGSGQKIRAAINRCDQQSEQQLCQLQAFSMDKVRNKKDELLAFEQAIDRYGELRFEEFVLRFSANYYRSLRNSLAATQRVLRNYANSLAEVGQGFVENASIADALSDETCINIDRLLSEYTEAEMEEHIKRTEIQIFESMVRELGGYCELLGDSTCLQHRLPGEIRNAAQRVLVDAYKKISLKEVVAKNGITPEQVVKWMNEKMCDARPVVDDCGGSSRVMLAIPERSDGTGLEATLKKHLNVNVKAINGTRGNFVFCFETEDVSLANIAYRLLQARPDAVELVKRIHSRNDVDWSSLNDLL